MAERLQAGDPLRDGRYVVQQHLRSPDEKDTYLGQDLQLNCQVAIDVFSHNSTMPSGLTVAAWEAQVLRKLEGHPNIAAMHDYWDAGGTAVMVTRYLPGQRLEELIDQLQKTGAELTIQRILQLSTEITDGLAYIHRRRILYRDLQPHNVLFDEWDTAHLVDFDTAVSLDDHEMSDLSHRPVISYMAPELLDGRSGDERADLYSLGATIYHMCEGHPPFPGTREQILPASRAAAPSLERDDLPAGLRDLIFCLLAALPEERPASATEVMTWLDGLRTARANLDRLPADHLGKVLKATLEGYLKVDTGAFMRSPSMSSLPDDHRCLLQAIMALAETDYRRAVIDAATATEVAFSSVIADQMRKKNWSRRQIDETIRDADGIDGLYTLYSRLGIGLRLPVSQYDMRTHLAFIRNQSIHRGRTPSAKEAARAVALARDLVNATAPFTRKPSQAMPT